MSSIARESVISLNDRLFLLNSLYQYNIRLDGRTILDSREWHVELNDNENILVSLGSTRVLVQINSIISTPLPDRVNEGLISFNINFSPAASEFFDQSANASNNSNINIAKMNEINRLFDRIIRDSHCIDLESLCIIAGHSVWSIKVNITLLDYNGNIIDTSSLAVIIALLHYRRPEVRIENGIVKILPIESSVPLPLAILHWPLTVSFALFPSEKQAKKLETLNNKQHQPLFVLDPSLIEELTCESLVVISLNQYNEICSIQKSGGLACSTEFLLKLTNLAIQRAEKLIEFIKLKLKQPKQIQIASEKNSNNVSNNMNSAVDQDSAPVTKSIQLKSSRRQNNNNNATAAESEFSEMAANLKAKQLQNAATN